MVRSTAFFPLCGAYCLSIACSIRGVTGLRGIGEALDFQELGLEEAEVRWPWRESAPLSAQPSGSALSSALNLSNPLGRQVESAAHLGEQQIRSTARGGESEPAAALQIRVGRESGEHKLGRRSGGASQTAQAHWIHVPLQSSEPAPQSGWFRPSFDAVFTARGMSEALCTPSSSGDLVGCRAGCLCHFHQQCYPLHHRGTATDVGVCSIGMLFLVLLSIGVILSLTALVVTARLHLHHEEYKREVSNKYAELNRRKGAKTERPEPSILEDAGWESATD